MKTLCCLSTAPSAPGSVKFSELTTTSVNVSWEAPQFPNGPLEGYRLVYEPCTPVDGEWGSPTWPELSPIKGWFALKLYNDHHSTVRCGDESLPALKMGRLRLDPGKGRFPDKSI